MCGFDYRHRTSRRTIELENFVAFHSWLEVGDEFEGLEPPSRETTSARKNIQLSLGRENAWPEYADWDPLSLLRFPTSFDDHR